MNTKDILLYETGSGGDFAVLNNDLMLSETLYQQIYLALFGGNVEADTKSLYLESEDRFDYWGNSLVWKDSKGKQFNSKTERILQEVVLNSSGRLKIVNAVNSDLEYMSDVAEFTVDVGILSSNKVSITVSFKEKKNQQNKKLQLIFDNARNEVIIDIKI